MSEIEPMHWVNRLLFFSAGVNKDLISQCPRLEWVKYTGIGASVLFTSLLALISSFFAFTLITDYVAVALLLATLWSAMIFNLDRFLVATVSMQKKGNRRLRAYLPRFVLAFFIALVISRPIELKLFESEITQQLTLEKKRLADEATTPYQMQIHALDIRAETLDNRLQEAFERRETYYEDYKCECDGTCGTGVRGRGSECARKEAKYLAFLEEYDQIRSSILSENQDLEIEKQAIISRMEAARINVESAFSTGLLARLKALSGLSAFSSLAILGIFLLIEIAPLLTKMMAGDGPYESLIQEEVMQHKVGHLSQMHKHRQELWKQQKVEELTTAHEVGLKEEELKEDARRRLTQRHAQNRQQLGEKLSNR